MPTIKAKEKLERKLNLDRFEVFSLWRILTGKVCCCLAIIDFVQNKLLDISRRSVLQQKYKQYLVGSFYGASPRLSAAVLGFSYSYGLRQDVIAGKYAVFTK